MGGRRARSTADVLGPSRAYQPLERDLQSALDKRNPQEIASASSTLATKALESRQIQDYFSFFLPYIKAQYQRAGPVPTSERRQEVRSVWSEIKRDQKIEVRSAISDAVVQAVINFLRRQGL